MILGGEQCAWKATRTRLRGGGACRLAVADAEASQQDAPQHQEGLHQGQAPEAQVVQVANGAPQKPAVVVKLVHALACKSSLGF